MVDSAAKGLFAPIDTFVRRHVGPSPSDVEAMLKVAGADSMAALMDQVVPESIRRREPLQLGEPRGEYELLDELRAMAQKNQLYRSLIGMGYAACITPPVIQRNILENPGWYTAYTPYQAEISQGRMEALLNFQTMVSDLTGLPLSNASMLDEGTAAAEAMNMCYAIARKKKQGYFVAQDCHPQTIAIVETRAEPLGIQVHVGDPMDFDFAAHDIFGVLLQYPTTDGRIVDYSDVIQRAHDAKALVTMAAELMALVMLKSPGEWGADMAVGSTQRFGVPMGFGGPHAGYLSTRDEYRRQIPGRLIGVSKDVHGHKGYRLALQTREQHIRRDRATSNICTSQVLLAVMAGMYAVYHGPKGLEQIAGRIHAMTHTLADGLRALGHDLGDAPFFDTLRVALDDAASQSIQKAALDARINLRIYDDGDLGLTLDETCDAAVLESLLRVFAPEGKEAPSLEEIHEGSSSPIGAFARQSEILSHEIFHRYHSEHEMLRYIHKLQARDLSLVHSMIPLGSCTMKLNGTSEMLPVTWPEFGSLHPFAPEDQWQGYKELFRTLEDWLAEMTGFSAVSLQPNAGSQGEYAGLLTIRGYHLQRGDTERDVCLIPVSAHGTNPASAVMAGMKVVAVACNDRGDIEIEDLRAKAEAHKDKLAAMMITYPSTHGVFEEDVKEACEIVHANGGLVYMDGANMNAQLGLTRPGDIGADVCHLNLHKTFCLSEGTPVTLSTGVQRPIEQLLAGSDGVMAYSEPHEGIHEAHLDAVYFTGTKPCVEVVLEDGRSFVCTEDHRVLTTEGWCEAQHLEVGDNRLMTGLEAPLDDPLADPREADFEAQWGGFSLSMREPGEREKCLAFFRLLGLLYSDGSYSQEKNSSRRHLRVYLGTRYDALQVVSDIQGLCGVRPTISSCNDIFSVRLPAPFLNAFEAIPGIPSAGKRSQSRATLPPILKSESTPLALRREFLGALFGGDGSAPLIVHLQDNPNTLKELRFSQSRECKETVEVLMEEICALLGGLGVEAYTSQAKRPKRRTKGQGLPLWRGELHVVWGSAFAERVGFRYCLHKRARLSAATAWWRMRETILEQKKTVARRVLERVARNTGGKTTRGPIPIWKPALAQVYGEYAAEECILNPYYTGFQGFATLLKCHFTRALDGQIGARKDIRGLRRTHRRAVLPAENRQGEATGMPSLEQFLGQIGALSWFNSHTPGGSGYSVTYANDSQEDLVEPTFRLQVIAVRPVGERKVYDLTVARDHNFLANGAVVHNCIPHGGGGPGMGPIGVVERLEAFLPGHPIHAVGGEGIGPISAAPYGSPSILPISWVYIALMGSQGLHYATEVAILNANYMASRLKDHYPILYTGPNGRVAHEFVVDLRPFKADSGVEVVDVAKRLMDFGFHAPTMSWPVPGTLMIEPTESESKAELDRFCEAMITIKGEIEAIAEGRMDKDNNPLKNAPHPFSRFAAQEWPYPYSREQAAFPAPWVREHKFWPPVARIDDAFGDRNLVCTCPPMGEYE